MAKSDIRYSGDCNLYHGGTFIHNIEGSSVVEFVNVSPLECDWSSYLYENEVYSFHVESGEIDLDNHNIDAEYFYSIYNEELEDAGIVLLFDYIYHYIGADIEYSETLEVKSESDIAMIRAMNREGFTIAGHKMSTTFMSQL
jgi:hypothetical protein